MLQLLEARLTVINFDTDPIGNPISNETLLDNQFLSLGVDLNSFSGSIPRASNATGGCQPISPPNMMTTVSGFGVGGGGFEAVFPSPVRAVGVFFCDVEFLGNTFTVRDTVGSSLGTFDIFAELGAHPLHSIFFGVISDTPIAKLQVNIAGNDFVLFDNLEFDSVALPAVKLTIRTFKDESAFANAVGSGLTIINFDTDPAGNPIASNTILDQQYVPLGVDFNPFGSSIFGRVRPQTQGGFPSTFIPPTPPNALITVFHGAGGGGFEAIFSPPNNAVGLFFGDLQDHSRGTTTFEIFNASGNSLKLFDVFNEIGAGPLKYMFFGVISHEPIAKLQIAIGALDYVSFDNFQFGSIALPPANRPPIANAGADRTVECTSPSGAQVTLNGTASSDPDGDPLIFSWSAAGITFDNPNSPTPTATFLLGTTTVTLTIEDGKGGSAQDTMNISVVDTTSPVISSVTATPSLLWPPNHKLVTVTVSMTTSDTYSPAVTNRIAGVISNEPDSGFAEDDLPNDIQNINGLTVQLRAERGEGTRRIYTITVSSADASGNTATATVTITVPKSQKVKAAPELSPATTTLAPNFLNPFNPETWIPYTLAQETDVTIRIYDVKGQLVRKLALGRQTADFYLSRERAAYWDGRNSAGERVTSGIYFYQLQAGNFSAMRRMLLLK